MGLPKTSYSLRIVENHKIVLYKDIQQNCQVLKPRRDLYKYTGDFSWGYNGTGVKFLATSILGHHLNIGNGGPVPDSKDVDKVIELLASIPQNSEADIPSSQIDSLLK